MIPTMTLRYLVKNRIKDAEILFRNKRYPASLYMAGYAVEIALKYKICRTLQFNNGFPETRQELSAYLHYINRNNPSPLQMSLGQIRNHNLPDLLFYSGIELRIKSNFHNEWRIINMWKPENRYKKLRVLKSGNDAYLRAAKRIIKEIN